MSGFSVVRPFVVGIALVGLEWSVVTTVVMVFVPQDVKKITDILCKLKAN